MKPSPRKSKTGPTKGTKAAPAKQWEEWSNLHLIEPRKAKDGTIIASEITHFLHAVWDHSYSIPGLWMPSEEEQKTGAWNLPLEVINTPSLVWQLLRAVALGDFAYVRRVSEAMEKIFPRASLDGKPFPTAPTLPPSTLLGPKKSFELKPVKPAKVAALESINAPGPKSGEDINQDVWRATGGTETISPRHARRIAAKLGKSPASKGGCGTHKP